MKSNAQGIPISISIYAPLPVFALFMALQVSSSFSNVGGKVQSSRVRGSRRGPDPFSRPPPATTGNLHLCTLSPIAKIQLASY